MLHLTRKYKYLYLYTGTIDLRFYVNKMNNDDA